MNNGIQFRITATKEQLEQMEHQCLMTEQLMATTLARRIEGLKAEEAFPFILDWFKSVRNMAHANWISCNIQSQAVPIGTPLPGDDAALTAELDRRDAEKNMRVRQNDRLGKVNEFIQKTYCITPNSEQLDILRKLLA